MTMRRLVKDTVVRQITAIAVRRALRVVISTAKDLLGTQACHRKAIALLKEWAKWAPVADDTELPARLFLDTLTMIRDHSSTADAEVTARLFAVARATTTPKPPESDEPAPDEGSTTTGE